MQSRGKRADYFRKFVIGLILAGSLVLLPVRFLAAQQLETIFDENDRYDIYFDYGVIKSVRILGTKEVNGTAFIVVYNSNLKNKGTQGYIRFDTIEAILPTGYINAVQAPPLHYQ